MDETNRFEPRPKKAGSRGVAKESASGSANEATSFGGIDVGGATSRSATPGSSGGLTERLKERASSQLERQKVRATDGLGSVAEAVRQSTQPLRDGQQETIARYVERAADRLQQWSEELRTKDVGELVGDLQRLVRRQPAIFLGAAFALGLLGARFMKSSPPDRGAYGYAPRYGAVGTSGNNTESY